MKKGHLKSDLLGGIGIKVAIMGAGLSGLVCAIMLEKNGIYPTIFEKRSQVGDRFVNGETFLSILSKPTNDAIAYFADTYGVYQAAARFYSCGDGNRGCGVRNKNAELPVGL